MMDRYVICGHYPTCNIRDDGKNLPYISKYYMDIDCGHSKWGGEYGPICCYCVDSDSFIFIYG